MSSEAFKQFVEGRLEISFDGKAVERLVHEAHILRVTDTGVLERYMADRVPYFYKDPRDIASSFEKGYFLTAFQDAIRRLPTSQHFRESHFGEILAATYGEAVLGLRMLYSKLSLLTAENANAYKMDILFYRPNTDPIEFVFAEVKSSMKTENTTGLPARHDNACFSDIFATFNGYSQADLDFDLSAIEERLSSLAEPDRARISEALLPHRAKSIEFIAFAVIDKSTRDIDEASVLATRRNAYSFNVDLICVTELPTVVDETYKLLKPVEQ